MILILVLRFIWLIVTNPSQIWHPSSLGLWLILSLTLLSFMLYQFSEEEKENLSAFLLRGLWTFGLFQTIIGYYQLYRYSGINSQLIKTPMIGTIGAPNGYGLFLTLALIALFFDLANFKKKYLIYLALFPALIIFSALLLNKSRGALFSLLCVILLFLILVFLRKILMTNRMKYLKRTILAVFISSVLLLSIVLYFVYNIDQESSSGRLMVWKLSFPMLKDNPLTGVGYNRYAVEYLNYQAKYFSYTENLPKAYKAANLKQAHNEYFQAFFETGYIGGVLFLLIFLYYISIFIKSIRNEFNNSSFFSRKLAIFFIFLAILIHSFIDSVLHVLPISVITYSILGILPVHKPWRIITFKSKKTFYLVLLAFISLSIFILYRSINQYPAYHKWQEGYNFNIQKRFSWSIARYQAALNTLPDQGELSFHLGSALVLSGSYSKGLYYLQQSLQNFNDRNIYLSMSYAHLKLGNFKMAEQNAQKALAMFPDHLAPHLLLGEIYYCMGDTVKSKYSIQKCMNNEITIKSDETAQIKKDASNLWRKFYTHY